MRPKPFRAAFLLTLCLTVLALAWPTAAQAQHRRGRGPIVFVSAGYYSPFFWPYGSWWYPYPFFGPYYYPSAYGFRYAYEADIRVLVKPKQAQVYVDGYYAGIVDDFDGVFQRLHVRPGGHEITLYLTGYRTVRQSIMVSGGSTYKLHYVMEPLPGGETAEAVPAPAPRPPEPGPEYRGRPPAPPEAPYGPGPGRTPPPGGQTLPPEGRLEATRFGTLAIRVQPADADVVIDGDSWRGPEGQDRLTVQLAAGPHRVEIRKAGYEPFSIEVEIRRGETTPLNVSLPRSRE
jgi:PEGA domain-containing protein